MRKITKEVCSAFMNRQRYSGGNSTTDGDALYLHGNKIAEWRDGQLWITNARWKSNVTKERLNGLNGVSVTQKSGTWFLNGKAWGGEWTHVPTI